MVKSRQIRPEYNIIIEQTYVVPNHELQILSETKTRSGHPKIVFKSRLQEHSVINKNGRSYSKVVCENIVSQLAPKAKSRGMLMEVDHPMFFPGAHDPELLKKRAAVVEVKNCGAVCRNISLNGNSVIGEIETLSAYEGPSIAALIQNDKIDIGFSLRALGGVTKLDNGVLEVQQNILPITYDIVSTPSHANAKIIEFIPENDTSILRECSCLVFEGQEMQILEDEDGIQVSNYNNSEKFLDSIIKNNFRNVISKKIQLSY